MRISKKSWLYEQLYWFREIKPDAVQPFRFCYDIFLAILLNSLYWIVVGISCSLFAWKRAKKSDEDLFANIDGWPAIFGHRIWPVSLIGLGFIIWPFVDFRSWRSHDLFVGITLFSLACYWASACEIWEKVWNKFQIVFVENGG